MQRLPDGTLLDRRDLRAVQFMLRVNSELVGTISQERFREVCAGHSRTRSSPDGSFIEFAGSHRVFLRAGRRSHYLLAVPLEPPWKWWAPRRRALLVSNGVALATIDRYAFVPLTLPNDVWLASVRTWAHGTWQLAAEIALPAAFGLGPWRVLSETASTTPDELIADKNDLNGLPDNWFWRHPDGDTGHAPSIPGHRPPRPE